MFAGSQFNNGIRVSLILATTMLSIAPYSHAQTSATSANREPPTASVAPNEYPAYVAPTEGERLRIYLHRLANPEAVFRATAGAGINQALDTPSEWHQGAAGYGRRFGSSYGEHIIQSTVMYGVSEALHEDTRYFRSGETGFGRRLKYALASTFRARHDDGTQHFSFSRISGYAASAGISRLWQPASTSGPTHAVDSFAISIGAEAGFNVAREFLPRIFRSHEPVGTGAAH
jgi:hypothetical protein